MVGTAGMVDITTITRVTRRFRSIDSRSSSFSVTANRCQVASITAMSASPTVAIAANRMVATVGNPMVGTAAAMDHLTVGLVTVEARATAFITRGSSPFAT